MPNNLMTTLQRLKEWSRPGNIILDLQENGCWRARLGLSRITGNTQFIFDKESESYSLGYRIMVSPKIRLEVGLLNLQHYQNLDFDNFTFGLNFLEIFFIPKLEKWPWPKN
ncbi:MAG: hypothetical protein HY920_06250 [Elusimicrobia bacterium]|nr:hypothetical protein [Elusimicrobiota bacterium]